MIRINGMFNNVPVDITISYEHSISESNATRAAIGDIKHTVEATIDAMPGIVQVVAEKLPVAYDAILEHFEAKLPWYVKWSKAAMKRLEAIHKKLS